MTIEQGGPAPDQRGEKAPFFFWKNYLTEEEKTFCYVLVKCGGMLGWNKESIDKAPMKLTQVEDLVKRGVLRKTTLFQLSKEFIEDDFSRGEKEELNRIGFVHLTNEENRDFFRSFDQALQIVEEGETPENLEERYQIARRDVYDFIDLMP